ncbi:MAG: choice-of-anchor Q domain-containing protein [Bacteroidales bacterium]
MKIINPILTIVSLCLLTSSCMDDIEYSNNPNKELTFSNDTIRFDTLFSNVPSTTKWIKVYNRNREHLLIEEIKLNNNNSSYRLNVDGEHGKSFTDIEIRGNDSLYIAVETTLPESGNITPMEIKESILFSLNNKSQRVELSAWAWDANLWRGKVITEDTILSSGKPFVIYDSLVIDHSSTLTIEAGCNLFFHSGAKLIVDGKLLSLGEAGKPVTLSGDRLDKILPDLNYDQMAGQWSGVEISSNSYENLFKHTIINSTLNGVIADSSNTDKIKVVFENSIIHNSNRNSLLAKACNITALGSQFSNAEYGAVRIEGGKYKFIHCTLADYYPFATTRGAALQVAGDSDTELLVANSIIYGRVRDEVKIDANTESNSILFHNCLIRKSEENSDSWVNTIWNKDPLFSLIGENYNFDFRIKEDSPAVDSGNSEYTTLNIFDFYGVNRLDSNAPDIGAFEYKE